MTKNPVEALRFAAGSAIMICTGATCSEVCGLAADAISDNGGIRSIRFPDRRGNLSQDMTRSIPLLMPACAALDAFLTRRMSQGGTSVGLLSHASAGNLVEHDLAEAMMHAFREHSGFVGPSGGTRGMKTAAERTFLTALYRGRAEEDLIAYLTARGGPKRLSGLVSRHRFRDPANVLRILNHHHVLGARYA